MNQHHLKPDNHLTGNREPTAIASSASRQVHGPFNGQADFPYADERFGWGCYGKNGCTLIAVYNALLLLAGPVPWGKFAA